MIYWIQELSEPEFRELMAEVYTFLANSWNDRKSQAVRFVRSRDPKERSSSVQRLPRTQRISTIISLVRTDLEHGKKYLNFKEQLGMEKLLEIQNILSIFNKKKS
jgi:hypothetical protein